jgi:uncharacterized surface anchored protein
VVKGLQGAEFTFKLKSEVEHVGWDNAQTYAVITTDVNGKATTEYLPYGQYQVRETKTPDDYITAPDFLISVTEDYSEYSDVEQIKNVYVNNRPFTSQVKLIKVDAETGKTVTFHSASFKIKDSQGNYIQQKVGGIKYDTFTTNSENNIIVLFGNQGEVTIPLQLDAGDYTIEEVMVPKGFLALEEPVKFTITNIYDYEVDEDEEPILVVTIKNAQPKATIKLTKTFEASNHVEEKMAIFTLRAEENIISAIDGSTIYKANEVIPNPETEDGYYYVKDGEVVTIPNLPMGIGETKYQLVEIETAEGYVISEKPISYIFKQEDENIKVYEVEHSLENVLTRTTIQVEKIDADTKEVIKGVHGFIFALEITSSNVDTTATSIITAEVDPETGHATFENIGYGQIVKIKEIETNKNYYLSKEVKEIVINKELEGLGNVHTFQYENVPVKKQATIKTGDNINIVMPVLAIILAAVIAVGILRSKSQKDKDHHEKR